MTKKVIIDTDPAMGSKGGDPEDSFALLLALNSPELEVVGITTVQGNVPVERGYSNAAYLLSALDKDIPLHAGPAQALTPERSAQRQGLSKRENMEQIAPLLNPEDQEISAAEFIVNACLASPGEIELVTIGPLTNVALALQMEPSLAGAIAGLTMMAGAAKIPGNITPAAEFNVWADPEAADLVFRAGIPQKMIPLDVCHQTNMGVSELKRIGDNPHPFCQFVQEAVTPWLSIRSDYSGEESFHLYDSLAMAAAFHDGVAGYEDAYVVVETEGHYTAGATVCEFNESIIGRILKREPNTRVALEVDVELFNQIFSERVIEYLRQLK